MKGKQDKSMGMMAATLERRRRIKVLNWGDNPNSNGKRIHVGQVFAQAFAHPNYAFRLIPLDYEHNTEPTMPAYQTSEEPRPIAGYGIVEVVPDDGVYMTMIMWAAEPDGWAAAHTYADVSANPVVDPQSGEVVAVKSVALVRTGATDKHFLDVPLAAEVRDVQTKGAEMDWKKVLIKALGLAETASDDEVTAALTKRLAPAPEKPAEKPAEKTPPQPVPLAAQIAESVNAAVSPLAAQFKALTEAQHRRDVDAILERARQDGKAVPLSAEQAYALPLDTVVSVAEKTPVTVPLSARTPERVADPALDAGPTDAQREVAARCGMDPEAVFGKPKA